MSTVGIIAEYNPFHNGHKYQIDYVRNHCGADNIVVVMSGDFVQRGTPAWADKYLRARMALEGGADFVFELPVIYAAASAEPFARGAVALLNALGFVDKICFGCENTELDTLELIARKDISLTGINRDMLTSGISYPEMRTRIIADAIPGRRDEITKIMNQPNNTLAIEYLKALKILDSNIKPLPVKRCDKGYNSTETTGCFASASGIRKIYGKGSDEIAKEFFKSPETINEISSFLPDSTLKLIADNSERIGNDIDSFSEIMYYRLRSFSSSDELTCFSDVSKELADRIFNLLPEFNTLSDFTKKLKTRQYTYSRISRALLHILLGIEASVYDEYPVMPCSYKVSDKSRAYTDICTASDKTMPHLFPYARLLGMRKSKSAMLRNISDTAAITKVADAKSVLCPEAYKIFKKDIYAADIYNHMTAHGKILSSPVCNEYRHGVIIV